MNDRTLPNWFRLIIAVTAISQTVFGLTLIFNPGSIDSAWPWPLTSIATRILGASTLVSVPLAVIPVIVNRWSAARIPIVMLLTYRVFQLVAGLIHIDRFDFTRPVSWNYFGGGTFLLVILGYVLLRGDRLGQPVSAPPRLLPMDVPLRLNQLARVALLVIVVVFMSLGVTFLVRGADAAPLWLEADGALTPLTARLFSSPMIGLALGLLLISRSTRWHEVAIPAIGMATFGVGGTLAILFDWDSVAPPSAAGYFIVAIPALLLVLGASLLATGLRTRRVVAAGAS